MEYLDHYNCPCSGMYNTSQVVPVANPEGFVTQYYASLFNKYPFLSPDNLHSEKDNTKKEGLSMKVTYNNYTGELWKLERIPGRVDGMALYNITILCQDGAKVSFERVPLDCLRFSGAEVVFKGGD